MASLMGKKVTTLLETFSCNFWGFSPGWIFWYPIRHIYCPKYWHKAFKWLFSGVNSLVILLWWELNPAGKFPYCTCKVSYLYEPSSVEGFPKPRAFVEFFANVANNGVLMGPLSASSFSYSSKDCRLSLSGSQWSLRSEENLKYT